MSFTKTVEIEKTQAVPAPFPNTKGVATLKILNSDQALGPAVALLKMEPGSEIARHMHEKTTETSYVLDGDFINEGVAYHAGTEINSRTRFMAPIQRSTAVPYSSRSAIRLSLTISS